MKLAKLVEKLEVVELRVADPEVEITSVSHDSKKCGKGTLFVALKGTKRDGHEYIPEAIANGADAVLCEHSLSLVDPKQKVANIVRVADGRDSLAAAAAEIAGNPSKKLTVIGVTGTNGKTTVVSMLCHILEGAGVPVVGLTTVGTLRGGVYTSESDLTTPDPVFLQHTFAKALADGVTHVVMEVSSHSLSQKRVAHTKFKAGAFTNLTEDHLDFHGTMDAYFAAKAEFFKSYLVDPAGQYAVIWKDDPAGKKLASLSGAQIITCSMEDRNADICAEPMELTPLGSRFEMALDVSKISQVSSAWIPQTGRAVRTVGMRLPGTFNIANSLVAAGLALGQGVGIEQVAAGIESFPGVPGRLERIDEGQRFTVIVDYAHTPDALENVLRTLQQLRHQRGRVILVMGNGGDRDRDKRPLCGSIGAEMSHRFFVTTDNPRTEDPDAIIAGIVSGVKPPHKDRITVIPDRRKAIEAAISIAGPEDIVLIAGKGHETYQIIGTQKFPFDDREVAREILRGIQS
ncbi:MAG: UDP-N-acetylmuramoyl-L-alanyl-D-glutamate--2,6-diaminopimelate ligase [bacterium]|jgi:UDP-N-acetylmuramoyl-L-alanyl-D-glutamate--2,6-diaminopimelate ligase